jgi:Cu(I)/Ag(I) efflux system membrane fusion protein
MKRLAIVLIPVVLALAAGYWFGRQHEAQQGAQTAPAPATAKKLLYYRNPMGLPDTSPVPKKDPMGMDYLPVYEGEDSAAADSGVRVSAERVQKLGVRTVAVARRPLDRLVRASGRVEFDERRLFAVAPRFEGWVERLHVNVTGQPVAVGQPLFEVYSPELVSAQREYALAARGSADASANTSAETRAAMRQLAEASLARLRNWDISEEQLQALAAGGEPRRSLTFRSPAAGVVTEKKAVQGMRFTPGETLYQVANVSSVWVVADVPEQDIAFVKTGARATIHVEAYPEREFVGTVSYIYPSLKAETRSVPVRLELANPGGLLKPAMYARIELAIGGRGNVLAVPRPAVIDSGTRRVAVVDLGDGRFESREVKTGTRGEDYVEILEGLKEGERVVVAGNFLLDSESNLKAALGGLGKPAGTAVGHHADGRLDSIDGGAGTVTITHQPVASLNWPAMTMEFVPAHAGLLTGFKPGTPIAFDFVERKPGEWVITKLDRRER